MSCIYPEQDLDRWSYCDNTVVLANADYYFTKEQTEELIEGVSGMTPEQVQSQIDRSIKDKADKTEVSDLAQQVRQNTQAILNTYTKQETNDLLSAYLTKLKANEMFANYSKIENTTLILNSENIN